MSFKLNKWGAEIANAKSLLDGVNYYRYEIPSGDTITTAGYFPKDLGLKLGDRIWCIPATKTNADALYVVSNISSYGVITVALTSGSAQDVASDVAELDTKVTTLESKIPAAPEEDGSYVLTCTVADGAATYSWESTGE